MSIQRCSERAFAMCPTRHLCGTRYEATFSDNSECAEFNKKVDSMPMTNADRIRAMSDEELAEYIDAVAEACYNAGSEDLPLSNSNPLSNAYTILEWLKQPAEGE